MGSITPISAAIISGNINFIKLLKKNKAKVKLKNKAKISPICYACVSNNYEIMKLFLNTYKVKDKIRKLIDININNNGIHKSKADIKLQKFLISKLKDLDELNSDYETVLHQLCHPQHFEEIEKRLTLVKILIKGEANIKNKNNKTALKLAKQNGLIPIKNYLSKNSNIFTSFKQLFS